MSMPINADAFDKMVDQDVEWLKENSPECTLYQKSIIQSLQMAKKYYREVQLPSTPIEAWDC